MIELDYLFIIFGIVNCWCWNKLDNNLLNNEFDGKSKNKNNEECENVLDRDVEI